jgi:hypothetical protein
MYWDLHDQFLTFPNGEGANARLLTNLPGIRAIHWWTANPLVLPTPELVFSVYPQVSRYDNYPVVTTGIELYSQRLLTILAQAGVRFQSFPAILVDVESNAIISTNYAVFHLLECYPAIDIEQSTATHLILTTAFLHHARPLFRPAEAFNRMFIRQDLRTQLQEEEITGCLYEPIEALSVAVALRRPRH